VFTKKLSILVVFLLSFTSACTSINKSHMNASIGITIDSPMDASIDVDMT